MFAADFVLHLALVEKPRRYLFSFTGLIDASAVLFFFVPQVRSELLLWVFKFRPHPAGVQAAQVHR